MNLHTLLSSFVGDLLPPLTKYISAEPKEPLKAAAKVPSSLIKTHVNESHSHSHIDVYMEAHSPLVDDNDICKFCQHVITQKEKEHGDMSMFQSTECFHMYHLSCFTDHASKTMTTRDILSNQFEFKETQCASCHKKIEDWEIKEVIGSEKWQEIE